MARNGVPLILMGMFLCLSPLAPAAARARDNGSRQYKFQRLLADGAATLKQGKYAGALAYFEAAKKIGREKAAVYLWIGLTRAQQGNHRAAAGNAEQAIRLDPGLANAWILWGQSLLYLKEWKKSREKLEQAQHLSPRNHFVLFNLGRCYLHGFGNANLALTYFQSALELKARYAPARLYMGHCYLALKDQEKYAAAITAFKDALRWDPTSIEARFWLAYAYRLDGSLTRAESLFLEVLARAPRHYEAHLQMGHLYLSGLPRRQRAFQHLKYYLHYAPLNHPYRAAVKKLLALRKDNSKAKRGDAAAEAKKKNAAPSF